MTEGKAQTTKGLLWYISLRSQLWCIGLLLSFVAIRLAKTISHILIGWDLIMVLLEVQVIKKNRFLYLPCHSECLWHWSHLKVGTIIILLVWIVARLILCTAVGLTRLVITLLMICQVILLLNLLTIRWHKKLIDK